MLQFGNQQLGTRNVRPDKGASLLKNTNKKKQPPSNLPMMSSARIVKPTPMIMSNDIQTSAIFKN